MTFETYLKSLEYTSSTIERYQAWEREFNLFFSIENKSKLSYNDLIRYIQYKQKNHPKRSTMVLLLGRIKHYYKYLNQENPLVDFKLKGKEVRNKGQLLTTLQLKQIAVCYHQNRRLSLLSKVAISLLVYQGLSTHELPLLQVKHIDLNSAEISLPSKRLNERVISLEASQILDLMQLTQDKKPSSSLLDYEGSRHLQNRHTHWKEQIKKELEKQKIRLPFKNLQQLRNSRIAEWVKDLGILHAQYLAGHHRLGATQAYQTEDYEQLRATFAQLHPFY